jgi:hypothetical protein
VYFSAMVRVFDAVVYEPSFRRLTHHNVIF